MGITHSVRKALYDANDSRLKALMKILDLDIKSEATFVYMKNSVKDAELVISSGEIKVYKKVKINKDKILSVEFLEPIKFYGKSEAVKVFSVDIKNPNDDIILFSSNHNLTDLLSDFIKIKIDGEKLGDFENKLVFSHKLSKFLVHRGFRIIDMKPDRKNKDNWIPVFLVEDGFYEAIDDFERIEGYKKEEKL